jgi:hypothetical protein
MLDVEIERLDFDHAGYIWPVGGIPFPGRLKRGSRIVIKISGGCIDHQDVKDIGYGKCSQGLDRYVRPSTGKC